MVLDVRPQSATKYEKIFRFAAVVNAAAPDLNAQLERATDLTLLVPSNAAFSRALDRLGAMNQSEVVALLLNRTFCHGHGQLNNCHCH